MTGIKKDLRVVLTGGGTGGHIYPAVAVGRRLLEVAPQAKIYYIGTARGLEKELVPKEGWPFYTVEAAGLTRQVSLAAVKALLTTGKGYLQARRVLKKLKPDLVLGTGGYVCGPVVLAAAHLGLPTVIHEQNAYPGLTNRLLARVADRVCLTFPQSARYFPAGSKMVETGLPIRPQILAATREEGLRALALPDGFRVLVVGGSQGARSINQAMLEVYDRLKDRRDVHWLHVTGPASYEEYRQELAARGIDPVAYGNITLVPYVYQMEYALSVADLVIGRAGASFLAEITAKGLPAILIPYPFAAENHQEFNARAVAEKGGAVLVKEKDLSGAILAEHVRNLADRPEERARMAAGARALGKPDAADRIIAEVLALTGSSRRK